MGNKPTSHLEGPPQTDPLAQQAQKLLNILRPPLPKEPPEGKSYPVGSLLTRISQQHEGGFQYEEMTQKILPELERLVLQNKEDAIATFQKILQEEVQSGLPQLPKDTNEGPKRKYMKAWAYFFGAYYFEEKHKDNPETLDAIQKAKEEFPDLFGVTDKLIRALEAATKKLLLYEPEFTAFSKQENAELKKYWENSIKPLLEKALNTPEDLNHSPSFLTIMTQSISKELSGQSVGVEGRLWTALLAFFQKQGAKTYDDVLPQQEDFIKRILIQTQTNNRSRKL